MVIDKLREFFFMAFMYICLFVLWAVFGLEALED